MSIEDVLSYFRSYDTHSFGVTACQGSEPGEGDVAKFEDTIGFRLPDDFRTFAMSPLGGLYMVVREELWPRAKAYDVGPFWSFLYGLKVFGIAEGIPPWLDIRVQFEQMKSKDASGLVPCLQIVGDAGRWCFDANGRVLRWTRAGAAPEVCGETFGDLLMQQVRDLEVRRDRKLRGEDKLAPTGQP